MHAKSHWILRYGSAIWFSGLALLIISATPLRAGFPFLVFTGAVLLTARYGGFLQALLATALACVASIYLFLTPALSADPSTRDAFRLVVFVVVSLMVSSLTVARERAQASATARARQQAAVAELGQRALALRDLTALLDEATRLVCQTLDVEYSQVLEPEPDGKALLLRAGHGWKQGLVEHATVVTGSNSQVDYTLQSKAPAIVRDLRREKRFNSLPLLRDHSVVSGISVIIYGSERPFGILGAHSTRARAFGQDDVNFLQAIANVLASAVARDRTEAQVREQSNWLSATLTSIGDGVIATDRDGKITFINSVAQTMTGWSNEEALGQPLDTVFRILNEETGAVVESPASRVLREHQVVKLEEETLLIAKGGRRIILDDSSAPIRDAHAETIGVVVTFRDATRRRRTERDISQLASIVQSTDDAILTMTLEGIVQTWNPGAEALYGYAADEIIGKSIMTTYPPEHRDELHDIVARIKRGELTTHFETTRIRKDGRRIDVSVTPSALRNAAGELVGISKIARDITERKRAERAQRFLADAGEVLASSLDYETTLKSVARLAVPQMADWCSVHIKAEDGNIQQLALAHVDPQKLQLAYELQKRYPSDPNSATGIAQVIRTGKPHLVRSVGEEELSAAARDVDHLQMLLELNPRSYMIVPLIARGRILGAITFLSSESGRRYDETDLALAQELARRAALAVDNVRLYQHAQALNEELERRVINRTIELQRANRQLESEISERQRAYEQLRLLSGHLQSAREDERVRIAREIHDEIGQVLTAVKMDLSLLERGMAKERGVPNPDRMHEQFDSTRRLVDQALDTMHGIVRELRPEILDHLGLQAAIEWQVQEFQSRTNIACQLECSREEIDIDEDRSIAVFRIFQEALTNVARHSGATQVQVLLKQEDHQVLLRVQDNGNGIDEKALREAKTFGVLGMRERAHVFGGQVDIQGTPGKGTVVSIRIPL